MFWINITGHTSYLYMLICTVAIAAKKNPYSFQKHNFCGGMGRFTVFATRPKNDYLYLLSCSAISSDNKSFFF
jgi:hypothetical protein